LAPPKRRRRWPSIVALSFGVVVLVLLRNGVAAKEMWI
jgi:hypothetical protein